MRTFQALAIVLCVFGAIHLLQGPAFFWPDRFDPSHGVLLGGLSSRLLGAGLVVVDDCGRMAGPQAGRGAGRAAPPPGGARAAGGGGAGGAGPGGRPARRGGGRAGGGGGPTAGPRRPAGSCAISC